MSKEHKELQATLRIAMAEFDAVRDRLESLGSQPISIETLRDLAAFPVALSSDTPPDANTWRKYVITWVARDMLEERERARELKHIREEEVRDKESAVIRARQRDTNNAKFDSWNRRFDHNWRQDNWN